MIVSIIAGAPTAYIEDIADFIIAVDKGVDHAIAKGLKIDVAIGDFDSVDIAHLEGLNTVRLNPVKDETDLFVAIEYALKKHPEKIYLYGASNGRLDHYLANVELLGMGNIELVDELNRAFVKSESFLVEWDSYISFLHYEGTPELSLTGFKYNLTNYELKHHDTLCVSNELVTKQGRVQIKNGSILVIYSKDE